MKKRSKILLIFIGFLLITVPVIAFSSTNEDYIPGLEEWYEFLEAEGIDPESFFSLPQDDGNSVMMNDDSFIEAHSDTSSTDFVELNESDTAAIIRYNVLVIDVSGSMRGLPMQSTQIAAQRFVDAALGANGTNYVAIVSYASSATLRSGFTDDPETLSNAINRLSASGGTGMNDGLLMAEQLLNDIPETENANITTNILLLSDGLPNVGSQSPEGPFSAPRPSWRFANAVYHTAQRIMADGHNIYSLGFFHDMSGATLNFARYFKSRLHNMGYFDVVDPHDLNFVFDEIINEMFGVPIIVIPGIAGSSLAHDEDVVWLCGGELAPDSLISTRIPRLALDTSGASINNITVREGVYGPNTHAITHIYQNLMEELRDEFGDQNVHFFAYDWRLDNAINAEKLRNFIEEHNFTNVDIVAHGMGGLVSARYIADGHGDSIRRLVTIGTPFLGTPKMPYVFATGDLVDYLSSTSANGGIRRTSPHMISAYQLLPYQSPYLYIARHTETADDLWWSHEQHDYLPDQVSHRVFIRNELNMIDVDDNPVPRAVRGNFLDISSTFMDSLFMPDGSHVIETVDHHVIAGANQQTIHATVFDSSGDYVTDLRFIEGDGKVPHWSATINGRIQGDALSTFDYTHSALVGQTRVLDRIIEVLNATPIGPSDPLRDGSAVVVRIASPVDVTITHNGETLSSVQNQVNTSTGFGSLHFIGPTGESLLVALNADDVYDVVVTGAGEGTMNYNIRFYDPYGGLIEERVFLDVPITNDTVITTDTELNNETTLHIDTDGSGSSDLILHPSINSPVDGTIYGFTIEADTGGRIAVGENGTISAGTIMNIAAESAPGFEFIGWSSTYGGEFGDDRSPSTTFVMPNGPTAVIAHFELTDPDSVVPDDPTDTDTEPSDPTTPTAAPTDPSTPVPTVVPSDPSTPMPTVVPSDPSEPTPTDPTVPSPVPTTAPTAGFSTSETQVYLPHNATSSEIAITSDAEWTASSSELWLSVSPLYGSGNDIITITSSHNLNTVFDRSATVTLTSEGQSITIYVTQDLFDVPMGTTVSRAAFTWHFLTVPPDTSWGASSDSDWITLSPSSGTGGDRIAIVIEENTTQSERRGRITVTSGGRDRHFAVTQTDSEPPIGNSGQLVP